MTVKKTFRAARPVPARMIRALFIPVLFAPLAMTLSLATGAAEAAPKGHGEHGGKMKGVAGSPATATADTRTINVMLYDTYFEPASIEVTEGETVRFVIVNKGELVHEFSIGTPGTHKAHAPMMEMMVEHGVLEADRINQVAMAEMQDKMGHGNHAEPNSALLEPGKSAEIVWKFPDHARIQYACNVPGHYDAGMVGEFELTH